MSTRDSLIAKLEVILDGVAGLEDVRLVKSVRAFDKLRKPVLIVKTQSLVKLPQAPIGNIMGEFLLTLVSPHLNMDTAEDQLDELLAVLLPTLFSKNVVWTSATQVSLETNLAYDIAVSTILK